MALEDVYNHFESYKRGTSDFEVFSARGCEASEIDLEEFESAIGFRLPEEFREFSTSYLGGLYMVAKESIWPPPKEGDVGPFWTFLRGLIVFGLSKEAPPEVHIKARLDEFESSFGKTSFVPFMKIFGCADCFCFDSHGRIFEFYHDAVDAPREIKCSFSDLLMREIHALVERTIKKKSA